MKKVPVEQDLFICIDCETTGLDPIKDDIIEVAVSLFNFDGVIRSFESLIDPGREIPEESIAIHHITQDMVVGKPRIQEVLPQIFDIIQTYPIVGHGVSFDVELLKNAAKKHQIACPIPNNQPFFDTLRMARIYGKSPTNSLEMLRQHFNIPKEGAHRAMSDVIVNIEVFKFLTKTGKYKTKEEILKDLAKPIEMATMPLGKNKGRYFKELPTEYLQWAIKKNFDQDLMYSLRCELKRRKEGKNFNQLNNPFQGL